MDHLKIVPAAPEQAGELAALAKIIWEEHFTPIIGAEQVAYMLEKFQSGPAMRGQMEHEGFRYYFFLWDGGKAGYTGIRKDGASLFLSKLYVRKEYRGRKIARAAVGFLLGLCRKEGLEKIWLTCNRHNTGALGAYRALGFSVTRRQVTDIGSGFVMDDDVLELPAGGCPERAKCL
ncbi:MAG: GNAT family N-acetyltransferase [Oscillospiraceae bacterium]|jgi:ribosomal protein S18 acetylase RimI-like enzyme|nr:GNAT family N-acetyltransferase [Oscillospiraceae bacterium]MCI1990476.1 GNAT family N-acetyltransferase [Oscillospiraceae bacterium]MCI2035076.1 GNAT family N-acetyltransferase [Oscillospiraceae bacterium]